MSYVSENRRSNPVTMGAAILVNGSIILAVALSPMVIDHIPGPTVIVGRNIPEPTIPPETKKVETPQANPIKPAFKPDPVIETKTATDTVLTTTGTESDNGSIVAGAGGDDVYSAASRIIPKIPMPVFTAASRDSRYAKNFQPDYPVAMLRMEIEGSVTVRILVGTDGRVRQVQILSATDDDFAKATEKQALKAWRFKPATRDGIAVEDWQTLTVRFDIN